MSVRNLLESPTVLWQSALVKLPRIVPPQILRYTTPEGPQPVVLSLPSRSPKRLIPVYAFVPPCLTTGATPPTDIPTVIDFHGGGFFMGSCLEQAPFCAKMARDLSAVVLSVDYRMGPIDKFPAALEDAEDVLSAVLDPAAAGAAELRAGIIGRMQDSLGRRKRGEKRPEIRPERLLDPHRTAIAGFSSGANIALNLALHVPAGAPLVREAWPSRFRPDHPVRIPLLLYFPSLDCRGLPSSRKRPEAMGPAPPPSSRSINLDPLFSSYLPPEQGAHPRASPGLASVRDGGLHDKARMLLVLPELDMLSEQSEVWVRKVAEEGRADHLKVVRFKGMKHGWTQFPISWLNEEERKTRDEIFDVTVGVVRDAWEGRDLVPAA